jgi:hypothetical protein
MKPKQKTLQCDPEGFYLYVKSIPFCNPPQGNYTEIVPIFENIMDQFDYLEDLQNTSISLITYNLLSEKHVRFSGILAIEIHSN